VQVDPIKTTLKPPGTKHLKLKYDKLPSSFAFNFNLRRYNKSKPDLFIVTRTPAAKAGTCILHPKSSFKLTSNDPSHRTNSSQPTQYVT
jgi:hypothetical protein